MLWQVVGSWDVPPDPCIIAKKSGETAVLKLLVAMVAVGTTHVAIGAQAKQPFTGTDFSGVYDCKGHDAHDGAYQGAVTLKLVPAQSFADHGAYTLTSEVPGLGTYTGYAAVMGKHMSFYFGLSEAGSKDYGTAIATFAKTRPGKKGQWSFHLYYHEPEYHGGNVGLEDCVRR
jgi:hypothetical protein